MLIFPPPQFRRNHLHLELSTAPAPPGAALVLVAASYAPTTLTLTFDRAVDVSGFAGSAMMLSDQTYNHRQYTGAAATSGGVGVVVVTLIAGGSGTGFGVQLTAQGTTGIKAVNDGGLWPGVTQLALPYPDGKEGREVSRGEGGVSRGE